jgi:branched-chain amino acid transport system substrate-binding protein
MSVIRFQGCLVKAFAVAILLAGTHAAHAQNTIKVGMNGALTGPCASLGKDALHGLELAVDEINARGGVKGRKIELLVKDDECKPPMALQWAKQFVDRDNVVAYFPSTNTTPNLASLQATVPAGVPHIIAGTTSDVLCPPAGSAKPCDANVVRLSILNSWQATAIVDFVQNHLKSQKIALLHDSAEYGQDGGKRLNEEMAKRGIKPVYVGTFEMAEKNFKPHLTKVKEAGADVIVTWTLDFVVAQLALQKKELGLTQPLIGTNALTGVPMRTLGKEAVEGIYMTDGMTSAVQSSDPALKALMQKYQQKYKTEARHGISYFTVTYYDAMHLLARTMEQSGTDRAAIANALANSGKSNGVVAEYEFSPSKRNGRDPSTSVKVVRVKDGALVNP